MNNFFIHIQTDAENEQWKTYARMQKRFTNAYGRSHLVEAIKAFRNKYHCGLKEAKDVVEEYIRLQDLAAKDNRRRIDVPGGCLIVTPVGNRYSIDYMRSVATCDEDGLLQAIADASRFATLLVHGNVKTEG